MCDRRGSPGCWRETRCREYIWRVNACGGRRRLAGRVESCVCQPSETQTRPGFWTHW